MPVYDPEDHQFSAAEIQDLIDLGVITSAAEYYSLPDWIILGLQEEIRQSIRSLGHGKELGFQGAFHKGITDIDH